jgi:uncharacterized protein YecT (DUF1311 family)
MRTAVVLAFVALLMASPALAQGDKPDARASAAIQDCIKANSGPDANWETCIGLVSEPCLKREETRSTADNIACIDREAKVWDDILNETFRRLREKLDEAQQRKLRDMQRAWLTSRDRSCAFYWDYFQGTMASPMSAACMNREIGRRALFLLGFLNDAEGK